MASAVLFDIDGTILDANLSIRDTMNRVLFERGQPTFTKAELDGLIGNPLRVILAEKCKDPAMVEAMVPRYRTFYGESGWVLADLFPGIHDLVLRLRAHGVRTGIVTSKGQGEAEKLLADLGIADLFDAVVGDDDVRPLKPDPAPLRHACGLLAVPASDTAMAGDTRFDVLAAKAAGVQAVGVLWGNGSRAELEQAGADLVARDVQELGRLLSGRA
ncbi:MAG: HAD family hydrolase [Thermoplasmatota archaeon]|nr:HAD family hydrolase [Halobacteriales archaeon]